MVDKINIPLGVTLSTDIEYRGPYPNPYRARARWWDPEEKRRRSASDSFSTEDEAKAWLDGLVQQASVGVDPDKATMELKEYGESVWSLACRGLEPKTLDPYGLGWRKLVVPSIGHIDVRAQSIGITDRAVHAWIADGVGKSMVKNALAIVGRIGDQAIRDGLISANPFRITGWQGEYAKAAAELEDPRALALADYTALKKLSNALVAASADKRYKDRRTYDGWGDVVEFMACTATRIGEVSGVRAADIDLESWIWTLVRQTTPSPGGLQDKRPKSKRARYVPIMPEIRPMVKRRVESAMANGGNMARLFSGPRGGRITTAVLRDATDWDNVVTQLGYEHLRRHDLRHTGLTWMADAGVPLHVLREIAGHGDLSTTQRYLHANHDKLHSAGHALQNYLVGPWSQTGPKDPPGSPHP